MSDSMSKPGYDDEQRFIKESEQAKLTKIREERAALKQKLEKEMHWMKCPKCGSTMEEKELSSIMIDQCTSCDGIYLDSGELELLMNHKESDSFIGKLFGFVSK
ncbi:MAG: zf-TFIIB domain-containing protein [Lentisphaeraceae bacterium]|nr:zf-TFIIB domain-containing protein [Lentisphaeraceae bacterium]